MVKFFRESGRAGFIRFFGSFLGLFLGLKDPHWRRFISFWMGISLVLHLVTAYFSIGHHSADEYFQILEFLSYKLGKTPAEHLPVEFREQMRPWIQPWMYWCMTQVEGFIGIQNPFTLAFSFRLASGLVGWISTVLLACCSQFWFKSVSARNFAVKALALIWFFPALHVRPSSESLSGSVFLIALGLSTLTFKQNSDWKYKNWLWLGVGVLLGLSFEFRFQLGFMILGISAWLLFFGIRLKKMSFISYLAVGAGIILSFALGRCIDYWGYGNWVISPWHYVEYNLLRGEVSKYGTAPWWDVFRMSMTESWPILGFGVAISTVIAWIRHPRHILTWSQIPFFLIHEVIAHKEGRFFFPIASAAPILITLSLYSERTSQFISVSALPAFKRLFSFLWKFLYWNNLLALAVLLVMPFARTVQFFQGVYQNIPPEISEFEMITLERNPYIVLGNPIFFYRPPQLKVTSLTSYEELNQLIGRKSGPVWLFDSHFHLPEGAAILQGQCQIVYQNLPPWVESINWGNWLERTLTWTLYRCEKELDQKNLGEKKK